MLIDLCFLRLLLCAFCVPCLHHPLILMPLALKSRAMLNRRCRGRRSAVTFISQRSLARGWRKFVNIAFHLALGLYLPPDRGAPPPIDHTIGIPTNGKWPISWTNQRILIAGGRCKRIGMTASDITIQMKGPYSDATLTTSYGELSNLRIQFARLANNRNTTDHPKATPKCIRTPIANVKAPPLNASGPSSVLATP